MKRDSVRRNPVRSSSFKNTVLLFLKCVKTLMREKGQSPFKKPSFREQQETRWSVLVRMGNGPRRARGKAAVNGAECGRPWNASAGGWRKLHRQGKKKLKSRFFLYLHSAPGAEIACCTAVPWEEEFEPLRHSEFLLCQLAGTEAPGEGRLAACMLFRVSDASDETVGTEVIFSYNQGGKFRNKKYRNTSIIFKSTFWGNFMSFTLEII